jgi:hypothetical protein
VLTSQSGTFWFAQSSNPEVMVKMIDGGPVNGYYWFFYGSLTSLSYQVEVTDTVTGESQIYESPEPHCGHGDVEAF